MSVLQYLEVFHIFYDIVVMSAALSINIALLVMELKKSKHAHP